jgi:hypothetical protein
VIVRGYSGTEAPFETPGQTSNDSGGLQVVDGSDSGYLAVPPLSGVGKVDGSNTPMGQRFRLKRIIAFHACSENREDAAEALLARLIAHAIFTKSLRAVVRQRYKV